MTLTELVSMYIDAHNGKPQTLRVYRTMAKHLRSVAWLGQPIGDTRIDEVTPVAVQHLHDELAKTRRCTGGRVVRMIRCAWQWGRRPARAIVPAELLCPCSDVEWTYERVALPEITPAIQRACYEAIDKVDIHPQVARFLRVQALVGWRQWSELLTLTCEQLYRSGHRWCVRHDEHKTSRRCGAKVRSLGQRAAVELLEQREAVGGTGPLWPGLRGRGRMDRGVVRKAWRLVVEHVRESGVVKIDPALSIYRLRNGAATTAIEGGATLIQVQRMLGHDSAQTTLGYLTATPGLEAVALDRVAEVVAGDDPQTLPVLARLVGCEPSVESLINTVNKLRARLARSLNMTEMQARSLTLSDLNEQALAAFSIPKAAAVPGRGSAWDTDRFVAACKAVGVANPNQLRKRINERREAAGRKERLQRNTVASWWQGVPPSTDSVAEIGDTLGVSFDYLLGRDLEVA